MSFCPTTMSYILIACSQVAKQLMALCDLLVTNNMEKKQRDAFLPPNGIIIIYLRADLENLCVKNCLRILNHNDKFIITK